MQERRTLFDTIADNYIDLPGNVMTYEAPQMINTTTSGKNTDAFHLENVVDKNGNVLTLVSHTFLNNIGTLTFNKDIEWIKDNTQALPLISYNTVPIIGLRFPKTVLRFDMNFAGDVTPDSNRKLVYCILESAVPPTRSNFDKNEIAYFVKKQYVNTYKNNLYASSTYLYPTVYPIPGESTKLKLPNNVVVYYAPSKLAESTSLKSSFSCIVPTSFKDSNNQSLSIVSHTFSDGVGTVTFNNDVCKIPDYAFNLYSDGDITGINLPGSVTYINAGGIVSDYMNSASGVDDYNISYLFDCIVAPYNDVTDNNEYFDHSWTNEPRFKLYIYPLYMYTYGLRYKNQLGSAATILPMP